MRVKGPLMSGCRRKLDAYFAGVGNYRCAVWGIIRGGLKQMCREGRVC